MLEQGGSHTPAEWLDLFKAELLFDQLPLGQNNTVEEWSQAHAPSVVVALYRGIPAKHIAARGEERLLETYKTFVIRSLRQQGAQQVHDKTPHKKRAHPGF